MTTIRNWSLGLLACAHLGLSAPILAAEDRASDERTEQLLDRLARIEERLARAELVVHKLRQDYLRAMESSENMKQSGLSPEDAERIDREFRRKVEQMIQRAIAEIDGA